MSKKLVIGDLPQDLQNIVYNYLYSNELIENNQIIRFFFEYQLIYITVLYFGYKKEFFFTSKWMVYSIIPQSLLAKQIMETDYNRYVIKITNGIVELYYNTENDIIGYTHLSRFLISYFDHYFVLPINFKKQLKSFLKKNVFNFTKRTLEFGA